MANDKAMLKMVHKMLKENISILLEARESLEKGLFPPRNADKTVADRDFHEVGRGTGGLIVLSGRLEGLDNYLNDKIGED